MLTTINPLIARGVLTSTAVTDAAYVFFNAAVGARHRIRAANLERRNRNDDPP
jgi:hypothetical protein